MSQQGDFDVCGSAQGDLDLPDIKNQAANKMAGRLAEHTHKSGIIWLASYPKSGNTWTRAFLHNLLRVMRGDANESQDINKLGEFTTGANAVVRFAEVLGKDPETADRAEIAAARPVVQAAIADEYDGLSFVKTHNALVLDRGVPTINLQVTSGAIYIVRNPLDVAISYSHHTGLDIDGAIEAMASENIETNVTEKSVYEVYGSWSQHVHSWTRKPHRATFVMRYEDMIDEPVKTFGKLARHLLLDPTPGQLDEAIFLSSFDKLRDQEEKYGFRERPEAAERFFREGRSGQWKDILSLRQKRRIVQSHKEQMRRFGYWPLDG